MLNLGKLFIVRSSNKNLMKNILIITFFLSLSLAQSDKPFSISVLSDISFSSTDSSFNSSGLELVAMSHLRPNVMAMAYLHTPLDGSQSTVEEVYLNFMISQFKLGYFRPDIGIQNKIHKHTLNFISQPNAIAYLFGSHSWASLGFTFKRNFPTPWESKLGVSLLKNGIGEGDNSKGHSHAISTTSIDSIDGFSSLITIKNQFKILNNKTLSLGLNHVTGREKEISGFDIKFTDRTDQFISWFIQSEFFVGKISNLHHGIAYHPDEILTIGYIMIGRQFNQKYHLGLIVDNWSYKLRRSQGTSISIYGDYAPSGDDLVFRLKLMKDEQITFNGFNGIIEMSWALGSHRPKRY